jgi:hypothetical protein
MFKQGKVMEVLAGCQPHLHFICEWWKQLAGESEGKNNTGIFPASVDYTTDLHSLGQWMQERGVEFGLAPEAMATRQAAGGEQAGPLGNLSEEERASMRATRQASGEGGFGPGAFAEMSEEEREAMRATAEASGMGFPGGGRGPGARGQLSMLAELVIELLSERAAE